MSPEAGRTAIRVEQLGKRYRLGVQTKRPDTVASVALAWLKSPLDNLRELRSLGHFDDAVDPSVLWALQDVSFTVGQGEVLGVIGHNGAGKSTLLKILSRITPPSTGRVVLNGRVSSLIEVGTGFHPDLTGRENIYLNGTILGMTKGEVDRKFDEIVAFAEVEPFIDTPVKRYSSGMRVRLAFAVSAHLEPEILLVDEVLAVGDAAFQQKCLDKMDGVARGGRTVLFVSHNMQAIQRLCGRALLLKRGRLIADGPPARVIGDYLDNALSNDLDEPFCPGPELQIDGIRVLQHGRDAGEYIDSGQPVTIVVDYTLHTAVRNLLLGFDVFSSDGTHLFRSYDLLDAGLATRPHGRYESTFALPADLFQAGLTYFDLILGIHRERWLSRGDIRLKLNFDGPRRSDVDFLGALQPLGSWQVRQAGFVPFSTNHS